MEYFVLINISHIVMQGFPNCKARGHISLSTVGPLVTN